MKRTPLTRSTPLQRGNAKRKPGIRRDWSLAIGKRDEEGACRVCGSTVRVESAHVISRTCDLTWPGVVTVVRPERIVPLCAECHRAYDAHTLDLLPHLTLAEQVQAVADVGLEQARVRLAPSAYRGDS